MNLAVVVSISRWRATVHYTDCPSFLLAERRRIPIPTRMRVTLCRRCRPTREDLYAHTPAVEWYEYSPAEKTGVKVYPMLNIGAEDLERVVARRSLGLGRRPARREGWT